MDVIQVEQANRIESETGNDQFTMAYIQSVSTLHQPEIIHLDFLLHRTEPLHLPGTDADRALRVTSPARPVFLASSSVPLTHQEHSRDDAAGEGQRPSLHKSTLVISMNEHYAKFGEDPVLFEYLAPLNQSTLSVSKANQSRDSGISLNSSQVQEPPTMFQSSVTNPLEPSYEQALENLVEEPDYNYHQQEQPPLIISIRTPRSPNPEDLPVYSTTNELYNIDSSPQNARFAQYDPVHVVHDTDEPIYCEIPDAFVDERRPEAARYNEEMQRYLEVLTYPEPMLIEDEEAEEEISIDREDIYEKVENFARQATTHPSLTLPYLNLPPEFRHQPSRTEIDRSERTTVRDYLHSSLDPISFSSLKELLPEQLAEHEETAIRNETPYFDSTVHVTSHQPLNAPELVSPLLPFSSALLASLVTPPYPVLLCLSIVRPLAVLLADITVLRCLATRTIDGCCGRRARQRNRRLQLLLVQL